MKKNRKLYQAVFLFCIAASFGVQLIYILSLELTLSLFQKMILIVIQVLSIIGYTYFHLLDQSEEKRRKGFIWVHRILFVLYCLNLFYILFLDPDFGRRILKETLSFEEYFQYNVNLNPLETIMLFINGYHNHVVTLETLLRNLLGNFVVFMPMAYFLPVLFPSQRKWYRFVLTLVLCVFGVEVIQTLLRIGSGDIDDFLLNVFGALMMYSLIKCLPSQCLYNWLERN